MQLACAASSCAAVACTRCNVCMLFARHCIWPVAVGHCCQTAPAEWQKCAQNALSHKSYKRRRSSSSPLSSSSSLATNDPSCSSFSIVSWPTFGVAVGPPAGLTITRPTASAATRPPGARNRKCRHRPPPGLDSQGPAACQTRPSAAHAARQQNMRQVLLPFCWFVALRVAQTNKDTTKSSCGCQLGRQLGRLLARARVCGAGPACDSALG